MDLRTFLLNESINDKGIFKAVFLAGAPCAGKSYTSEKIKDGRIDPRIINTDKMYKLWPGAWKFWENFGDKIRTITKAQVINYINGVLPLLIDGTSNIATNMIRRQGILDSFGYDTGMLWIDTPLDVCIERVRKRERKVPEEYIIEVYNNIISSKSYYKNKFEFFVEIKNDSDLSDESLKKIFNKVSSFYTSPLKNPVGIQNMNQMIENKQKYLTDGLYTQDYLKRSIDVWYMT